MMPPTCFAKPRTIRGRTLVERHEIHYFRCGTFFGLVSGFSVLQVQGPCPFRIEVTNSLMQPQPPTVPPHGREAVVVANPRKAAKHCNPEPPCGLFGTTTEKQRAPTNTTPTIAVSNEVYIHYRMDHLTFNGTEQQRPHSVARSHRISLVRRG